MLSTCWKKRIEETYNKEWWKIWKGMEFWNLISFLPCNEHSLEDIIFTVVFNILQDGWEKVRNSFPWTEGTNFLTIRKKCKNNSIMSAVKNVNWIFLRRHISGTRGSCSDKSFCGYHDLANASHIWAKVEATPTHSWKGSKFMWLKIICGLHSEISLLKFQLWTWFTSHKTHLWVWGSTFMLLIFDNYL